VKPKPGHAIAPSPLSTTKSSVVSFPTKSVHSKSPKPFDAAALLSPQAPQARGTKQSVYGPSKYRKNGNSLLPSLSLNAPAQNNVYGVFDPNANAHANSSVGDAILAKLNATAKSLTQALERDLETLHLQQQQQQQAHAHAQHAHGHGHAFFPSGHSHTAGGAHPGAIMLTSAFWCAMATAVGA
jgi:hypothetical protein